MTIASHRINLINTLLQQGGATIGEFLNRFSGFCEARETAKAVQGLRRRQCTPLKRGVNEISGVVGSEPLSHLPPGGRS